MFIVKEAKIMNGENENNRNGNTVLLTVIGVATLLVALVGATFAYFSAQINNEQAESVSITTAAPVGLEYLGGEEVVLDNIIPGAKNFTRAEDGTISDANDKFTVTNPATSSVAQTYDLDLIVDNNDMELAGEVNGAAKDQPNQLLITVTGAVKTPGVTEKGGTTEASNTPQINTTGQPSNVKASSTKFEVDLTDSANAAKTYKLVNDQRIAIQEVHEYTLLVEFAELNEPQDQNQGKTFKAHIEISDPKSVK